ncbi:MAG: formate dehydrogenase subunit gamma [Nitriliruptoraceae bacterium]
MRTKRSTLAVEVEQTSPDGGDEVILRFRPGQRYVHLLVAASFVVLFLTGLPLIFDPLSFLAEGGWTRILHRIAAVGFMSVPILYFIVDREGAKQLIKESFTFDRDDFNWLMHIGRYVLGNAADMPPQGRLNAGQKLHHAAVMVLSAGVVISGLLLWFAKASLSDSMLGWTVVIHDVSMGALVLLLIGHVYFTVVYKAINNMHTGYMPRTKAEIEHAKWVAEIEGEASGSEDGASDRDEPTSTSEPQS